MVNRDCYKQRSSLWCFTRVVREDEIKKRTLYAGTERDFASWNGGKNWEPFQIKFTYANHGI